MPRALVFRHRDAELSFQIEKLDRTKLYGSVDVEAIDDKGRKCELATLASDGRTLLGKGGTAAAFLSETGSWLERAALKPVDAFGDPIAPVPSSFAAPVELAGDTDIDDYLSHNVKSVYFLSTEADVAPLAAELKEGKIFKFPYSFRGGLVSDVGFLLANPEGQIFLAVGQPTRIHAIGLDVQPVYEDEETVAAEGETDELDFGMM